MPGGDRTGPEGEGPMTGRGGKGRLYRQRPDDAYRPRRGQVRGQGSRGGRRRGRRYRQQTEDRDYSQIAGVGRGQRGLGRGPCAYDIESQLEKEVDDKD